jgi:hypothetical protein
VRRSLSVLLAASLTATGAVTAAVAAGHADRPSIYLVGGGVESINPITAPASADMLANHDFFLGGYGFGSGKVANQVAVPVVTDRLGDRYATGILGDGVHSRAFAVSDRRHTIVLAQIEVQGYFAAYKQGPFGLIEIRKDAAAAIAGLASGEKHAAPAPTASEIVVDSDHSHGGPDTVGVWGGVPTSYLRLVHDQTVKAIVDAWRALRPATLTYGVAQAGVEGESQYQPTDKQDWLLTNQFSNDLNNKVMDDEVRVLQAKDPHTGAVLDTYVNYSSHPTVLGSSNREVTGDYVGRLDLAMQNAFGGFGMDQVATLGREQPARTGCPTMTGDDSQPAYALCELDSYAARVLVEVREALGLAKPLIGAPVVAMNSYLMTDPATSPVLAGIVYAGAAVGIPTARAANPPWYSGNLIGTTYFVGRIGSLLVTGGPGEMYAQIWEAVQAKVTGMSGYLNIGTAGDFLGYIIAPLTAYPEPIRRSMLSGNPPPSGDTCSGVPSPVGCPDPVGNDNYFFNVSHTFGERLTCDFLRGAGDVLAGDPQKYWSTDPLCPAFANDLALPAGTDTQFPDQPDLSSVLTHM